MGAIAGILESIASSAGVAADKADRERRGKEPDAAMKAGQSIAGTGAELAALKGLAATIQRTMFDAEDVVSSSPAPAFAGGGTVIEGEAPDNARALTEMLAGFKEAPQAPPPRRRDPKPKPLL